MRLEVFCGQLIRLVSRGYGSAEVRLHSGFSFDGLASQIRLETLSDGSECVLISDATHQEEVADLS